MKHIIFAIVITVVSGTAQADSLVSYFARGFLRDGVENLLAMGLKKAFEPAAPAPEEANKTQAEPPVQEQQPNPIPVENLDEGVRP